MSSGHVSQSGSKQSRVWLCVLLLTVTLNPCSVSGYRNSQKSFYEMIEKMFLASLVKPPASKNNKVSIHTGGKDRLSA